MDKGGWDIAARELFLSSKISHLSINPLLWYYASTSLLRSLVLHQEETCHKFELIVPSPLFLSHSILSTSALMRTFTVALTFSHPLVMQTLIKLLHSSVRTNHGSISAGWITVSGQSFDSPFCFSHLYLLRAMIDRLLILLGFFDNIFHLSRQYIYGKILVPPTSHSSPVHEYNTNTN